MYLIIAFVVFLLLTSVLLVYSYFTKEPLYEEEFVLFFCIEVMISLFWPIGIPFAVMFYISCYIYDKIMEKKCNISK